MDEALLPWQERRSKGVCGKVIFDKKTAQTKKNFLERRGNERELRIYYCEECNGWHLTKVNRRKK